MTFAAQIRSNKSFVILCVLEAISFLMAWNSRFIAAFLNDVVRNQIESTVQLGSNVIQTLIWILIAFFFMRYVQEVMYIERHYKYLGTIEEEIGKLLGDEHISREGKSYLKGFLPVLNIIHLFYNRFCPVFFTAINIYHIVIEYRNRIGTLPLIADTALVFSITIIAILYFFEMNEKIRNKLLKIKLIARFDWALRKWLEGV